MLLRRTDVVGWLGLVAVVVSTCSSVVKLWLFGVEQCCRLATQVSALLVVFLKREGMLHSMRGSQLFFSVTLSPF